MVGIGGDFPLDQVPRDRERQQIHAVLELPHHAEPGGVERFRGGDQQARGTFEGPVGLVGGLGPSPRRSRALGRLLRPVRLRRDRPARPASERALPASSGSGHSANCATPAPAGRAGSWLRR